MIKYTEAEVLERINEIESCKDITLQDYKEPAITFWWEMLRIFKITGAKCLAFLVEKVGEMANRDFPSCIYVYNEDKLVYVMPTISLGSLYQEPVLASC